MKYFVLFQKTKNKLKQHFLFKEAPLLNDSVTPVFVEEPLASPGSANYLMIRLKTAIFTELPPRPTQLQKKLPEKPWVTLKSNVSFMDLA